MRHHVIASITLLVFIATAFSPVAVAQRGAGGTTPPAGPPHDPHDLSGVWLQRGGGSNQNPVSEWTRQPLPFTPAGKVAFEARKPGKGPRAGLPAVGNDPLGDANVPGLLRTLVYARPF